MSKTNGLLNAKLTSDISSQSSEYFSDTDVNLYCLIYRTFNRLWKQVGQNIDKYINFPRLIGECGGKNYHFIHPTADVESVITGTIRSAFEFCGQKCSACSRMYVPESLWKPVSIHSSHICPVSFQRFKMSE